MTHTIAIIGALDTKGQDFAFLKAEIERRGVKTLVLDTGVLGAPFFAPDIARERVAAAGGTPLAELVARQERGEAMTIMGRGAALLVRELYDAGHIHGIIGMGGGGGTSVSATAMRGLPVGFPKVMVSTVAGGDVSGYVGTSDIVMFPSIIDVAGLNRISRRSYSLAAGAICGMVTSPPIAATADKPLIAATMFGNTTRAVTHAQKLLEAAGYEVLVFHATGNGGRTLESLIADKQFVGVLDMTTTEWADEICGGVLSAGAERLDAAARTGIPQVVVPGCIDMCNFWARATVPEKYQQRLLYEWNPNVTLMRTTPDETARMGTIFAQKLNMATHGVQVFIPLAGVSEIDVAGKPFHAPEAIRVFADALRATLRPDIPVIEIDTDINDPVFVEATVNALLNMLPKLG